MGEEEYPTSKTKYEICPECHQKTLLLRIERKTDPANSLKVEQWMVGDCQDCGYSKVLRQIKWESVSD
jgi:ssDNA-binding Zn-finger/Zn-ribbon topoisomerase 1